MSALTLRIRKKKDGSQSVELGKDLKETKDIRMDTINEEGNNGWTEPVTDDESEGEVEKKDLNEEKGDLCEEKRDLNEEKKDTKDEEMKDETVKERIARKRNERDIKKVTTGVKEMDLDDGKSEMERMMKEMKKMKEEMEEQRLTLNEEKKEFEEMKKNERTKRGARPDGGSNEAKRGRWANDNRMRPDMAKLPFGWEWVTEDSGFSEGIFGFVNGEGKRVIGIENRLLTGYESSGSVKGIWNCLMVEDMDGETYYLDGGLMPREIMDWFLGGSMAHCCTTRSKRGVYKLRRMGRIMGCRREIIHTFRWAPASDNNIGMNLGSLPHDCKRGLEWVD